VQIQKTRFLILGLVILFLIAAGIRLINIRAPGRSIDREYTSAIFARSFYFNRLESIETWRREVAEAAKNNQPILEPPVTEYLVSWIYQLAGTEAIWISHLLTSVFWLIGGYFLFNIARLLLSVEAAFFSTAIYLFMPLGLHLSRSFQPEALMMMLFLLSAYRIFEYFRNPTTFNILLAGAFAGITVLYRPIVIFTLFGAFALSAINARDGWKSLFGWKNLLFLALFLSPSFLYYGFGLFVAGYLRWWVGFGFLPHLYFRLEFWEGWLNLVLSGIGLLFLVVALIGLPLFQKGLPRAFMIGLWLGYIVLGMVFNVHIHTHAYYHAQLIPIVALSIGPTLDTIPAYIKKTGAGWYGGVALAAVVVIIVATNFLNFRNNINYQVFNIRPKAREIGELVDHSTNTVFVAQYFGLPLQYFGEITGTHWPRRINYWLYQRPGDRELSIDERLASLGFVPEYFIITNFSEFEEHHLDLKDFLLQRCGLVSDPSARYLVYGNCEF
jgi:hypothetical protein